MLSPARNSTSSLLFTVACLLGSGLLITGCRACSCHNEDEVVAYTSVDQVYSEPVFQYCEEVTGLEVRAVFDTEETKSTGVLNRLIAEGDAPQADVFWSGDPVRPFLLIGHDLVEPYSSPVAESLPEQFRAPDGSWTGFAARARVLLVNTDLVGHDNMPTSIMDLADPRWRGQTAIANPLYGTTTMHVAALFTQWGDEEGQRFLDSLRENDVRMASSNGEVKRQVVSGEIAFGLTDTDDAFQAISSGTPVTVIYPDQDGLGTLVMPTSIVLMRDGPNTANGQRLIDCLLSVEVEGLMAESAAHMPLRDEVTVPDSIRAVGTLRTMDVDYAAMGDTMERNQEWLREWAEE